jgi:hypothetical protein
VAFCDAAGSCQGFGGTGNRLEEFDSVLSFDLDTEMSESPLQNINDDQLVTAIDAAQRRLMIVSPGISLSVARAVAAKWKELGAGAANVILDLDPNVSRMGYGEFAAVELLQITAMGLGAKLLNQAGTRICVFAIDDDLYVFSPTPLVAEAKKIRSDQPNGIKITCAAPALVESVTSATDQDSPLRAAKEVSSIEVATTAADLKQNPPAKFDITQKLNVFNAAFEFVEFSVTGCQVARKTVRLPPDLVLAARDRQTLDRVNSSFRLLDGGNQALSGDRVKNLKEFISKKFLVNLPNYGNVVLRTNKQDFENAVVTLRKYVERFQARVEKGLQKAMDESRAGLAKALFPAVSAKPPERSVRFIGGSPDTDAIENWLEMDLEQHFGTARDHIKKMEVSLIFKGVTDESLKDEKFIETAQKHLYSLKKLYEEFDTARAVDDAKTN